MNIRTQGKTQEDKETGTKGHKAMYKDTRRGTRGYKVRHKRAHGPAQEDTKTGTGGHKGKHRRTQRSSTRAGYKMTRDTGKKTASKNYKTTHGRKMKGQEKI
jgi:hypothetical protein